MRVFHALAAVFTLLAVSRADAATMSASDRFSFLTDREKNFLRMVLSGDEAKAVDYAQVAGVNPNSIGGQPLSYWYYTYNAVSSGAGQLRDVNAQRVVFERFKQNPNPRIEADTILPTFCNYGPIPQSIPIESTGTLQQRDALHAQQAAADEVNAKNMMAAFESLQRYGLKDKRLINDIFLGCAVWSGQRMTSARYDLMIKRLLKAGADINIVASNGLTAMSVAVQSLKVDYLKELVDDGASGNAPGHGCKGANIYSYLAQNVRFRDTDRIADIVRLLARAGASPFTPTAIGPGCKAVSFYDLVVDAGNLDLAKKIKESAAPPAKPPAIASALTGAGATQPAAATGNPTPLSPARIGNWQVATASNGLPFGTAPFMDASTGQLKELRLECVPGGRLEYVPVPNGGTPVRAIWLDQGLEGAKSLAVTDGRIAGPTAVELSKRFLAVEAEAKKNDPAGDWMMGFILNDAKNAGQMVNGLGFSQMRATLRQRCKG